MQRSRGTAGWLLASVLMTVIGCGGGPGGSTPEEAFAAFQLAAQQEDWGTVFDNVSPDTRVAMLAHTMEIPLYTRWGLAYDGESTPRSREWFARFDKMLAENGLDPTHYQPGDDPVRLTQLLTAQDERQAIYDNANDPKALLRALIGLRREIPGAFESDKPVRFEFPSVGALAEVRIAGEEATGNRVEGEDTIGTVTFRRVGDRWFVHDPQVAPELESPIANAR